MPSFMRFLAAAMVMLCPPMARGMELYVAPDGDDANRGTKAQPLATLEAARDAIREWKGARGLPEGGVTVNLRGGEYRIGQTFELGSQDSGSRGKPIVYRAFESERVRLVGGRPIPANAFRPIQDAAVRSRIVEQSARDKVLQVDLKSLGLTNYGRFVRFGPGVKSTKHAPSELFFDDQPMTVARWPNQGYVKIDKVIRRGSAPRFHLPDVATKGQESGPMDIPGVFRYRGTRPRHWTEAREVWLHGYWAYDWADECLRIGDIDTVKREITLSHPHWYGIKGVLGQGERYYALNLLEEIDIPGEYYLDPYDSVLYFYPPGNVNDKPIVLSLLAEPFVLMKDVSHVTLRGLVMEVSRGKGVVVEGGSHNRIAGCVIRNIADWAVHIDGGTDHRVVSCDIFNVGKGGISLVGGDQRTLTAAGHQAINNHIHHFSRRSKTYQFAIALKGVGHRMAHNLIHDSPHAAIDYRGNNHVVEFNEIHHVCQESDDAGAINTDRDYSIRGNVVRYNFFHHITGLRPDREILGAHMIYLDGCKSGDDFVGNVFYKGAATVIKLGGGRDVSIKNNIFVDLGHPVRVFSIGFRSHRSCVISSYQALVSKADYTHPPWSRAFPKLAKYPNDMDELSIPRGNVIANNLFYRTKEVQVRFDKEISPSIVTIENNYHAEEDPFVDMASMNFQLKDDSIVFKKMPGFKKIPFDKMGLYADEYRRSRR